MARTPDARLAANARRFQIRRLMHALVVRDTAMVEEPLRAQWFCLAVSWVAGTLALVVCAVLARVLPPDIIGDAPIVMVRDSGALYVRVDGAVHPVPNLASARLVVRRPADPRPVTAAAVAAADRGPALGIAGAPAQIGATAHPAAWLVCEDGQTVVVADDGSARDESDLAATVLATPADDNGATTYLLYDGTRAKVDMRDIAAVRALRLDGVRAQPLSRAVLDLLPEVPAIAAPPITHAGMPGPAGLRVGQVVRLSRAAATEYYVVLAHGLQRVGDVAADIIRFRYGIGAGDIVAIAPDVLAATPVADELAVSTFPAQAHVPDVVRPGTGVCARWRAHEANSSVAVFTGPLPTARVVRLAQADGPGSHVDAVAMAPGQSVYARAVGVNGDGTGGALYLIADSGVRFGIHDQQAAGYLGLTGQPVDVPWPLLAQLPQGPELGVDIACLQRDSPESTLTR